MRAIPLYPTPVSASSVPEAFFPEAPFPNASFPEAVFPKPSSRAALHAHDWPGNVRELEHCIESAVVLAQDVIDTDTLSIRPPPPTGPRFTSDLVALRTLEAAYVRHVLAWCDGNRSAAARMLGIGRNTLLRKLRDP